MFSYLDELLNIGKYIVIFMAGLGAVILIVGLFQRRQEIVMRGGYILLLSAVLSICGYLIYQATVDKAQQMIYDTYIEFEN